LALGAVALPAFAQPSDPAAPAPASSATQDAPAKTGRLVVREKQGLAIRVLIDGVDRGAAPLTIDLPVRSYEVSGIASTLVAAAQQIALREDQPSEILLEAVPAMARVEIRTSDGQGKILIDGRPSGEGVFEGELPVGQRVLRVERDGFEPWEKSLRLGQGQVVVESVTLDRKAEAVSAEGPSHRVRDGLYGGFQLGMALMPAGSDNTLDTGCDTVGASSCDPSSPWGVGVHGYLGYALEPLGFELLFGLIGDKSSPQAHFDGVHGSTINPLVAQPSRDEEFQIYRGGALAAVRVRGSFDIAPIRLSGALGAGLAWKKMGMLRTVTTTDGTDGTNEFAPEAVSYWSPGVTLDVGAHLMLGETTALTVGVWFWAETAGDGARTEGESNRVITSDKDGVPPRPIATPSYDLANGDQIFVGPYVGMQFGP
jgi:hypothetical protein